MIGVDVVDADRGVADARLAGAGIADGDLLPASTSGPPVAWMRMACGMTISETD